MVIFTTNVIILKYIILSTKIRKKTIKYKIFRLNTYELTCIVKSNEDQRIQRLNDLNHIHTGCLKNRCYEHTNYVIC